MTTEVSEATRTVANQWFNALKAGKGEDALKCLDKDVVWINNPPSKGLSDIVPWLGEYHGFDAVLGTFKIWGELSQVQKFELLNLVIDGDEALALVHEVAKIFATGLCYDIEFIQRLKVGNGKIVFWKSYWDTVKGIVPFRGDMHARLVAAAQNGDLDEAMRVLPFGADPNSIDEQSEQSVLMIAAGRGHDEMVKILLRFGADPNAVDRRAGASALHKACQGGHFESAKTLVENRALIDHQTTTTGHTPLIEAIWFKSAEIVGYLLARGARIELKTYYGFTIDDHINYAIKVNQGPGGKETLGRIKELVQQRRALDDQRIRAQDLNRAVLAGDLSAVRASLQGRMDLEQRYPIVGSFQDGHTPLLIAARDGHFEIVEELIKAGACVNAIEPVFGAAPLHKATYNGYLEITRLLANAPGVNLNYQGPSNGYTPLQDALWHGYAECAQVLIDAGASVDVVGYDGRTAKDIAIETFGPSNPIIKRLGSTKPQQQ